MKICYRPCPHKRGDGVRGSLDLRQGSGLPRAPRHAVILHERRKGGIAGKLIVGHKVIWMAGERPSSARLRPLPESRSGRSNASVIRAARRTENIVACVAPGAKNFVLKRSAGHDLCLTRRRFCLAAP